MRILLIKPETVGVFSYTCLVEHEPLELEYLYTVFRQQGDHAVIYDRRYDLTCLKRKLAKVRPEVVCITGYITQQKLMIRLCDEVKAYDPGIAVILGGSNVEINYRNYFESRADFLYHLSGVANLAKLVRYLRAQRSGRKVKADALERIPGICYRKDGVWTVNPKIYESPEDLALVKNSYSCRKACNFCFCTNRNGGRYACRKVEHLVDEIALLDVPAIHITDDDFLVDEDYLWEFIRLIREKGVRKKFLIYGRADFIAHHEELMRELARIGLALVMVGLEATDDAELDSYNKRVTLRENEECIRILHENHIFCAGLFIVHQQMTKQDFRKLYQWIADRDIIPTISVFTPMQGSAVYPRCEKELLTDDVTKQDLFHCLLQPEHMSVRQFTLEYYKLSLKLMWKNRKSALYAENNYLGAMLYILWVLLVKAKRKVWF